MFGRSKPKQLTTSILPDAKFSFEQSGYKKWPEYASVCHAQNRAPWSDRKDPPPLRDRLNSPFASPGAIRSVLNELLDRIEALEAKLSQQEDK